MLDSIGTISISRRFGILVPDESKCTSEGPFASVLINMGAPIDESGVPCHKISGPQCQIGGKESFPMQFLVTRGDISFHSSE